jgi:putative transposase
MGIRGIAIPYGAPNAAAHMERLIGTLRRECLDRMLIWNERHLRSSLAEFIRWYNRGRVRQGLNRIPDPDPASADPKPLDGRLVGIPVLNGLHHDYRLAA